MSVLAAVTEYPENAQIRSFPSAILKINNGSAIVIMDVTVSGTSAYGTGFPFRLKLLHVGVKKRF